MSSGKVLLGLLAGVAAGAMLGVLFAPDKGTETRRKISKKGEDYVDTLKEKFNDFIEGITEKFEQVKDDVSGFSENRNPRSSEAEDLKAAKTK